MSGIESEYEQTSKDDFLKSTENIVSSLLEF